LAHHSLGDEIAVTNVSQRTNFQARRVDQNLGEHDVGGYGGLGGRAEGLWGAVKEAFARSSTLAAAKSDAGANELVKAVVSNFETREGRAAVQDALRPVGPTRWAKS
jgi:hypothetical protein